MKVLTMKPISDLTTNNRLLAGHFFEETKLSTMKKDYVQYVKFCTAMNKLSGLTQTKPYGYQTFITLRKQAKA